jgi:hypothetical protein
MAKTKKVERRNSGATPGGAHKPTGTVAIFTTHRTARSAADIRVAREARDTLAPRLTRALKTRLADVCLAGVAHRARARRAARGATTTTTGAFVAFEHRRAVDVAVATATKIGAANRLITTETRRTFCRCAAGRAVVAATHVAIAHEVNEASHRISTHTPEGGAATTSVTPQPGSTLCFGRALGTTAKATGAIAVAHEPCETIVGDHTRATARGTAEGLVAHKAPCALLRGRTSTAARHTTETIFAREPRRTTQRWITRYAASTEAHPAIARVALCTFAVGRTGTVTRRSTRRKLTDVPTRTTAVVGASTASVTLRPHVDAHIGCNIERRHIRCDDHDAVGDAGVLRARRPARDQCGDKREASVRECVQGEHMDLPSRGPRSSPDVQRGSHRAQKSTYQTISPCDIYRVVAIGAVCSCRGQANTRAHVDRSDRTCG